MKVKALVDSLKNNSWNYVVGNLSMLVRWSDHCVVLGTCINCNRYPFIRAASDAVLLIII